MKKNRGVTLIALIITIIVMLIIVGISVTASSNVLQKTKMTEYIGFMKLVKARADVVLEDESFGGNPLISEGIDNEELEKLIPTGDYTIRKWAKSEISQNGIDSSILNDGEYFVVIFDNEKKETIDVLYSSGCAINSRRYYSLSQMKSAISKKIKVKNLITNGGFENEGWKTDTNVIFDSSRKKSGNYSLKLTGINRGINPDTGLYIDNETVSESKQLYEFNLQHQYYISVFADWNGTNKGNGVSYYYECGGPGIRLYYSGKTEGNWEKYSTIFSISKYFDPVYNRIDNDNGKNNANTLWVDDLFIIDLTATFGEGKEPKKAWCDANLGYGVTEVEEPQDE